MNEWAIGADVDTAGEDRLRALRRGDRRVRLTEWPRMPFLNDEVKEWIAIELQSLGVEDLAVYALEAGTEGDERRVMVATEVGLLDHRYAPFGSSARYRLAMLIKFFRLEHCFEKPVERNGLQQIIKHA